MTVQAHTADRRLVVLAVAAGRKDRPETDALLAALAIFAATPALAADKHAGHSHAAPAAATLVDGTVKKVDKAAGKLTLSHGPLPNGMPAMTMVFRAADAGMLDQVKVGGFDGSPDAVAAVKAGELQYTVLQPVAVFSQKAVEQADSFIPPPERPQGPGDGEARPEGSGPQPHRPPRAGHLPAEVRDVA